MSLPGPSNELNQIFSNTKASCWCTCTRYCEGGASVSKKTYDRHEATRKSEARSQYETQQFDENEISVPREESVELDHLELQAPLSFPPLAVESSGQAQEEHALSLSNLGGFDGPPSPSFPTEREQGVSPEFVIVSHLLPSIPPIPYHEPIVSLPIPVDDADDFSMPDPGSNNAVEQDSYNPEPTYQRPPEIEHLEFDPEAQLGNVKLQLLRDSLAFIQAIKSASLDDAYSQRNPSLVHTIRNPPTVPHNFNNPDERLAIDIYLALQNGSEGMYETIRLAYMRHHPNSRLMTLHEVKQKIAQVTGVIPITYDMCVNSCTAFVGPYFDHQTCPYCSEPRYHTISRTKPVPRQQFNTFPIGPQLQALWQSPESASDMRYQIKITHQVIEKLRANTSRTSPPSVDEYSDVLLGTEILNAIMDGRIKNGDTILMLSIDGAQLFRNKESDCWIYIWVILDHAPNIRYRKEKVLVGAVIPGPNKPKNLESFLFPGIHHLSAIQREGLPIWDAKHPSNPPFLSNPFFAFGAADGPGMTYLNGLVGHVGRMGCRLFCGQPGRRKPNDKTYYPAKLQPIGGYDVSGCNHPDHP